MILRGQAWKFGRDIDTDVIIPLRYCNIADRDELAKHCMEGVMPDFYRKVKPGDIIIAEENFGCGSSREPAPISIKATGISCIIAKSFARIFYRNAFNIGLPLLECMEAPDRIEQGCEVEVNLNTGDIRESFKGESFRAKPVPPFMQELIRYGGLMNYLLKEFRE